MTPKPLTPGGKEVPRPEQEVKDESPLERRKRLLAHVRVTRERVLARMGDVQNKNPNFVYVWVNVDQRRQVLFQALGYEKVTVANDKDVTSHWKKEDGSHLRGDLVLYRIPADIYDAIKLEAQIRSTEALETTKDDFFGFAQRERIPVRELR